MRRPDHNPDETIQVSESRYGRPFSTEHGLMVVVYEPDGDRYATYGVLPAVVDAWAEHDRRRRPL